MMKEPLIALRRCLFHPDVMLGVLVGTLADYWLYQIGFRALVSFRLISLADEFEGSYTHEGRIVTMAWAIFLLLFLCFMGLRKMRRLSRLASAALIAHCIAGGVWSLFTLNWLINPFL